MSKRLRDALREEVAALARIEDPAAAASAVGDVFAALDSELERLASVRARAIRAMSQAGFSYDKIAEATGLSKMRVSQIIRDSRH